MKIFIILILISSALTSGAYEKDNFQKSNQIPFILHFKEFNLRKKIREAISSHQQKEVMKKKVERILAYSDFGPNHWWTYSLDNGECTNAQMELKEYLDFLKDEKNIFSIKEDKKASFFRISVKDKGHIREKESEKEEVTFWTKDRYQCEVNKKLYRSLAQSK